MTSSEDRPPFEPPYTDHEYEGIPMIGMVPKESLDAMKTFEMRDGDVVVLSYPKSGTNWMHQIVHEILGGKPETALPKTLEFFHLHFGQVQPVYAQLQQAPSPRLIWTHLPFQLAPPGLSTPINKVKVIVMLRNPKDVSVSYYYYRQSQLVNSPQTWEQLAKDFLDGKCYNGDYFDHVLGWRQRKDDPHFLFVKYEDLKKDFPSSVKTISAFLEKELTDEDLARVLTNCSFESMRKDFEQQEGRKEIIRKGIVGDWKNHYSAEQSAKLDQKYRERMAGSGLEFEFE